MHDILLVRRAKVLEQCMLFFVRKERWVPIGGRPTRCNRIPFSVDDLYIDYRFGYRFAGIASIFGGMELSYGNFFVGIIIRNYYT